MKARTRAEAGSKPVRHDAEGADSEEVARLTRMLDRRDRELAQAREQQSATSEILRAISASPGDMVPVCEVVAANAARLCDAPDVVVLRIEGDLLCFVTSVGAFGQSFGHELRIPVDRRSVVGRSVVERRTVHVDDLAAEPEEEFPVGKQLQRRYGHRTMMSTPLCLGASVLGAIAILRQEVKPFSEAQIAMLQAFADQAAIAVENARLVNETREALAHRTATGDVLQVISGSMADAAPVFEKILDSCQRLFGATDTGVFLVEGGDRLNAAAWRGDFADVVPGHYPRVLAGTMSDAVMRHGALRHWPDVSHADDVPDYIADVARAHGGFSVAVAPLIWQGGGIGTLDVMRKPARAFTDRELRLLASFADQAVVAIQNARLFDEVQARNRDLTEALEQQTATAEILQVISGSPTDVQPVLDAVAAMSARLCDADDALIFQVEDERMVEVAHHGSTPGMEAGESVPLDRGSVTGRSAVDRRTVQVADLAAAGHDEYPVGLAYQTRWGHRTALATPLLTEGQAVGVIALRRLEVRPFADKQIRLLETFAQQAAIAIENVRLFNELQVRNREVVQALEQQTATSEILRVISRSPTDVQPVFDAIASAALVLCRAQTANLLTYDGGMLHLAARATVDPSASTAVSAMFPRPAGEDTAAGRAILHGRLAMVPDALEDPAYDARDVALRTRARGFLGVPLLRDGVPIGAIAVGRAEPGPIPERQQALLQTFADQAVIAIENVRLFNELRDKGAQLEIASRHKSQFLANMSHELRTPLNAIIGFTRIVLRRTRDQVEPKQAENLEKILTSGLHLLALINAVLDLSKIEAGRLEVVAVEVDPVPVLRACATTIEPLVRADSVALVCDLDAPLPRMLVDEEKLRQIVINLLSNAAKFTADGSIRLRARVDEATVRIAVADTGIGIASDKLGLVFEEFEQAHVRSTGQQDGTGLGLAISRRLARLMGGDVEAESLPGRGSTFTLTLPLRYRAPATREVLR